MKSLILIKLILIGIALVDCKFEDRFHIVEREETNDVSVGVAKRAVGMILEMIAVVLLFRIRKFYLSLYYVC